MAPVHPPVHPSPVKTSTAHMPSVPERKTSIAAIHLPAQDRRKSSVVQNPAQRKASYPLQGHRRSSTIAPTNQNRRPSQFLGPANLRRASQYPGESSQSVSSYLEHQIAVENTYKMEPDHKFRTREVEEIIRGVLEQFLSGTRYDGNTTGDQTRLLSDIIRERVKQRQYERYKIVSWVTICEKRDNNVRVASRGLWDARNDGYASVIFENETMYAIGNVYAVYHE